MSILRDKTPMPMLGTANIDRAKKFYSEILGLEVKDIEMPGMFHCASGDTEFIVYQTEYAGTNKANALTWSVGDQFDAVFDDLKGKGVSFEHYPEIEGLTLEGDIHMYNRDKLVWFKDPDGNLLHIRT